MRIRFIDTVDQAGEKAHIMLDERGERIGFRVNLLDPEIQPRAVS